MKCGGSMYRAALFCCCGYSDDKCSFKKYNKCPDLETTPLGHLTKNINARNERAKRQKD